MGDKKEFERFVCWSTEHIRATAMPDLGAMSEDDRDLEIGRAHV